MSSRIVDSQPSDGALHTERNDPNRCFDTHAQPDVIEIFFVLSGNIEVLVEAGGKMQWVEAGVGDLIEIPRNARDAFRNRSQNPVLKLLFTTSKHGRYFQEIGRTLACGECVRPPTPDEIQHFLKTALRYGYWFATPEQNASVGITVR